MHFLFLPFLFIASSVSTAILNPRDGYPACFQPCLVNFNSGGCAKADYHCLCNSQVFINSTAQCLYNDCSNPADIAQAIKTSQAACLAAGVTLTSTYTPTQSLSHSGSATSSIPATLTSGNATSTSGPSSTPTSSKKGAASTLRLNLGSAAFVLGAALLTLVPL